MIQQVIVLLVASNAPLVALIADRVIPNEARNDEAFPLVVYQTTGGEDPAPTLSGLTGWLQADIELTVVAETHEAALDVSRRLRDVLEDFRGTASNGDLVSYITCMSDEDDVEDRDGADPLHLRRQVYRSLYRPTPAPTT